MSRDRRDYESGSLVATVLAGAWRSAPPPLSLSASELETVAPLLLRSGAGALAWWRLRSASRQAPRELLQAYRLHRLQGRLQERRIRQAFGRLRERGIEPILGKGWAAALLYAERGLRPYGDIDLYVRPEEHVAAREALRGMPGARLGVDLHRGFGVLDDRAPADLLRRSRVIELDGTGVRIFWPEDHLRLLCLHMLGHGAWRPLWLCDIAAALESAPGGFDWDALMSGDPRRTEWLVGALRLASRLLLGDLSGDLPRSVREGWLPRWLAPTVLRQWGRNQTPHGRRTAMAVYLRRPAGVLGALLERWPNGVEATVGVRGPFNELPRLPFQLAECVRRSMRFASELPRLLGGTP